MENNMRRAIRPDAQPFDEVRITTVPRYKTSGLSGDEWRISAKVELLRKGVVKVEKSFRDVATAVTGLGGVWLQAGDEHAYYAGEGNVCDQEGCSGVATVTLRKVADFCREGHKSTPHGESVRCFCERHSQRGDCAFDDADQNYVRIG